MSEDQKNQKNYSEEELLKEIKKLSKRIHRINSKKRIFFNGILSGLARGFGATIIFGIGIAVLGFVIKVTNSTWLNELVLWLGLDNHFK
jgi:hypothetical protein